MTFKSQSNPLDPLPKKHDESGRELMSRMGQLCHGFSQAAVVNAAISIVLSSVREQCDTAQKAKDAFDEVTTRAREALLNEHYQPDGRRKNVFPFAQTIEMPNANFRQKF